ncbi:MAG: nitrogen regulation protein NR(II) [Nitrospiria bacterium]
MLRPNPEKTLFGHIPVRLIVSIILVFVTVISIVLILGVGRDKSLFIGFILTAVLGVAVLSAYKSYHSVRQNLESVKSLARNILDSIPTGVITIDSQGSITSINPAAEKILLFGNNFYGKKIRELLPESTALKQLLEKSILEGKSFHDQTVTYPHGDHTLVLWVTLSDLHNEGQRDGLVLLIKDISEINRLEQQVRRSEKLSAISTLSAAVAHEIRNPLSAMDLNLGLLEEEIMSGQGETPSIREFIDVLNVEIKRLKGILDTFARFSVPNRLVLEELKMESIIQHLVSLIRMEAHEKGIQVETEISSALSQILADENQITQVFLNIMINAIQAMPNGGRLFIQAEERKINNENWVNVRFSDTGVGIEKGKLNKIFEPFFSSRQGGTGLGLAISHRIIEDHGGFIHVDSTVGKGTVFTVQIPAKEQQKRRIN